MPDSAAVGSYEVDVGFTTEGTIVVGECTFTTAPLDYRALTSLEDHAAAIRWTPDTGNVDTGYALFTRSGATQPYRKPCPNAMTYTCSI